LALVGLFVWLTGCSTYTQIEPSEVADHGMVRVTLTDGDSQELWDPTLRGDGIWGRLEKYGKTTVIPVDSVAKVEYPDTDSRPVMGVVALVAVLAVIVAVGIAQASSWE